MAAAARESGVPLDILYSVGLTETGHQGVLGPYDLNVDGRSRPFRHAGGGARGLRARRRSPARNSSTSAACRSTTASTPRISARWRRCSIPSATCATAPALLKTAARAGRIVDAGGGALQRRSRQSQGAARLCLRGHRAHGGERRRRLDAERARVLRLIRPRSAGEACKRSIMCDSSGSRRRVALVARTEPSVTSGSGVSRLRQLRAPFGASARGASETP